MINALWLLLIVPGSMAVGAVCVICASLMLNSGRISRAEQQDYGEYVLRNGVIVEEHDVSGRLSRGEEQQNVPGGG